VSLLGNDTFNCQHFDLNYKSNAVAIYTTVDLLAFESLFKQSSGSKQLNFIGQFILFTFLCDIDKIVWQCFG